jgi:hypothetical protein
MRVGMYFYHGRILAEDLRSSQLCKVTQLRRGGAYYRPVYFEHGREMLGGGEWVAEERWPVACEHTASAVEVELIRRRSEP